MERITAIMNKQNYAQYGSYYCKQLESMERIYPRARDELQERSLIAVFRNKINIGQSIDGAGEQSFMGSSKTTGKASPRVGSFWICPNHTISIYKGQMGIF